MLRQECMTFGLQVRLRATCVWGKCQPPNFLRANQALIHAILSGFRCNQVQPCATLQSKSIFCGFALAETCGQNSIEHDHQLLENEWGQNAAHTPTSHASSLELHKRSWSNGTESGGVVCMVRSVRCRLVQMAIEIVCYSFLLDLSFHRNMGFRSEPPKVEWSGFLFHEAKGVETPLRS